MVPMFLAQSFELAITFSVFSAGVAILMLLQPFLVLASFVLSAARLRSLTATLIPPALLIIFATAVSGLTLAWTVLLLAAIALLIAVALLPASLFVAAILVSALITPATAFPAKAS